MSNKSSFTERFAKSVLNHPGLLLLVTLVAAACMIAGVTRLVFISDERFFFSENDPQLKAFEALERTFTRVDDAVIVVHDPQRDIFSREALQAIQGLTRQGWQIHDAYRVDSVTNYQHTQVEGDDLIVGDLFEDIDSASDEAIAERARIALAEPRLSNKLISLDGTTAAVAITFQIPDDESGYLQKIVPPLRALVGEYRALYPQLEFYLTGKLLLDNALVESAVYDAIHVMPIVFAAVMLMLVWLFRSVTAVLGVLLLVVLSAAASMGMAGWLGIKLSMASIPAPAMIMTLAVADAVHLLVSMFANRAQGQDKKTALGQSLRVNFMPVFVTSFTTAAGFLALNFNDVEPFRDMGNIAALGVMLAFLFSVTLLPAFLMLVPVAGKARKGLNMKAWLTRLGGWVVRRYRGVTIGVVGVSLLLLAMISQNELNNRFIDFFGQEIEFRRDSDNAMRHLPGAYLLEFAIPAQTSNGIASPEFLAALDDFVSWLRDRPEVAHVSAITDTFKMLNRNLNQGDAAGYRLPQSRELGAQYLLLYEMSLPYGLDLNNEIDIDKSATRLVVSLRDISTNEILNFAEESAAWLKLNRPEIYAEAAGTTVIFSNMYDRTTRSMISGTLVSLLIISLVLVFALKSVKYGLLSLVPNMLPAALAFGIWGMFSGQVNMAVSMVLTMTLGIVVDDTIHFMNRYLNARRTLGQNSGEAIVTAFSGVGTALVVTTLSLSVGLVILAQSSFAINSQSALLSAITIVVALFVDLLLLPALLLRIDGGSDTPARAKEALVR